MTVQQFVKIAPDEAAGHAGVRSASHPPGSAFAGRSRGAREQLLES